MGLSNVAAGAVPDQINVIIEIPMHSDPIKYEVDKATGALVVDRFNAAPMHYPVNYGYVPNTLGGDGDPIDVLLLTPFAPVPGVVVPARPIGILNMVDDGGDDQKIVAVPTDKLTTVYKDIKTCDDLPPLLRQQIEHFFQHYKDLEPGKWVKLSGWSSPEEAKRVILESVDAFKKAA